MSWTSLAEDDTSSSSDDEDLEKSREPSRLSMKCKKMTTQEIGKSRREGSSLQEVKNSKPLVQRRKPLQQMENLLAMKEKHIRSLEKLINGQREQLYHFLRMSIKKETLLELKDTCRDTDSLQRDENICMALDKFKYDNDIPTEQTMVRRDVLRTLLKLERLMRHQEKLAKSMEQYVIRDATNGIESLNAISCHMCGGERNKMKKLGKNTTRIDRHVEMLKVQLKKLALIEEERIDLVERVYSVPIDQRQYYAQVTTIEREKHQLRCEIDKLKQDYDNLNEKYCSIIGTEGGSNQRTNSKFGAKMGHTGSKNMELSPTTTNKDNEAFTPEHDSELLERLRDFDKLVLERDGLKKQIGSVIENSLRLQNEVKALRLANRTDDLSAQLKKARAERDQLKIELNQLTKDNPGTLEVCGKAASKIIDERDRLRAELAQYKSSVEDVENLRLKASQSEAHRREVERLKLLVAKLEAKESSSLISGNRSSQNKNLAPPIQEMLAQLQRLKDVEKQKNTLTVEMSRYKHALLKQEEEVQDLMDIVLKLKKQIKAPRTGNNVNPTEGTPEGPEITAALTLVEEKRLGMIQSRLKHVGLTTLAPKGVSREDSPNKAKNTLMNSFKSFLGLEDARN